MTPAECGVSMDFKEATDRLTARITHEEIARECGVSTNLIQRARLSGPSSRTPPAGWSSAVARLARERATALEELADRLEGEGRGQ